MITMITGIPGMGKTSLLIQMLSEYEKAAERPLFVMGIPDLDIEHVVAPPVKEWCEYRQSPEDPTLQLAYFTFPPNSILVVDEAQRVFPPRASASKKPAHVEALETHRHTGLDIILLTQKPKLVDMNVRELVGRHIHIRAGLLGRYLYEWPHVADGESRLDRGDAAKRKFSPPKSSFKKYKSAELHTKQKFRFNQLFIYAGLAIVFLIYQWVQIAGIFAKYMGHDADASAIAAPQDDKTPRSGAVALSSVPLPLAAPERLLEALTPTDDQNPLSAPLYASVKPPVVAPEIVGCIASQRACTCYSQQQTPVWLPDDQCRQRAAGLYYDPYRQPPSNPVVASPSLPQPVDEQPPPGLGGRSQASL
jgi:zona occludens toxin